MALPPELEFICEGCWSDGSAHTGAPSTAECPNGAKRGLVDENNQLADDRKNNNKSAAQTRHPGVEFSPAR